MNAANPIASLRKRLTLETPVDTPDVTGALQRAWTAVTDLWADIAPISGAEGFIANSEQSTVVSRVTIRWRADVTGAMRFRTNERLLFIRAVYDPDGKRRRLVCRCEEYSP